MGTQNPKQNRSSHKFITLTVMRHRFLMKKGCLSQGMDEKYSLYYTYKSFSVLCSVVEEVHIYCTTKRRNTTVLQVKVMHSKFYLEKVQTC